MNNGGNQYHLRDGQERFDEEEVQKIEYWNEFEIEKKARRSLTALETTWFLMEKERAKAGVK